jgi:surfeit locus 1 family protein
LNIFYSLVTKRIVATVSALLVVAIGCAAGFWQLSRANEKITLAEHLAVRQQMTILNANAQDWGLEEADQRRMIARGTYLPQASVWLDNRPRPLPAGGGGNAAQSGFLLMMPLKLAGVDRILWVNRGWAPRNNEDREKLPLVNTREGLVSIEGIVFAHPGKVYELGKRTGDVAIGTPRIEQNFDLEREGQLHHWMQSPFVLRETEVGIEDGLLRQWAPLTMGVDRHYAYAFQWFALAFSGFLFWLVTGLRQQRKRGDKSE